MIKLNILPILNRDESGGSLELCTPLMNLEKVILCPRLLLNSTLFEDHIKLDNKFESYDCFKLVLEGRNDFLKLVGKADYHKTIVACFGRQGFTFIDGLIHTHLAGTVEHYYRTYGSEQLKMVFNVYQSS